MSNTTSSSKKEPAVVTGLGSGQKWDCNVTWESPKSMIINAGDWSIQVDFIYEQYAKEENFSVPIKQRKRGGGYEFL